jgi:polar amino acid transport system ATP-binding protein
MENQNTNLVVKGLKKHYGKNKVLNGIDFELKEGERVVVLGPSGSGKSTFLRCINRLEEPSAGEIVFDGTPVTDKNIRHIRRNIGMVFQHFNLISNLTVMENLILAPVKLKVMKKDAAIKRAHELLKHIGLPNKADAYPASLSGGQKQRVSIARIFLKNPPILLLDEATSALDTITEAHIQAALEKLSKGRTTLVIAHRLSTIRNADIIAYIDSEGIQELGTHQELLEQGGLYAALHAATQAVQ